MPETPRRFIAIVSRLVPRWARREFRAEWEAEIAAVTRAEGIGRLRLVLNCLGAIPDAWFLFRQQWSADMLIQDLRQALRLMRLRPGFALVVITTLGLGIGANAAMFAVIDAVLLRPLPFRESGRLTALWENDRLNRKPEYPVAPANFLDWQEQTRAFDGLAAYVDDTATLAQGGDHVHVPVTFVTSNFFDVLSVRPLVGESFTSTNAIPGHHRVLVLSYDAWQRYFGGDPGIVGRDLDVGGAAPYHVLGVMPRGVEFPSRDAAFWCVLVMSPDTATLRAVHFLSVIGRLRPDVTRAQAQADIDAVAGREQRAYPGTNAQRGVTMKPLADAIVGDVREPLYVLLAAVCLVLLIACANIANLMLVRASGRRREMAVRAALGADRLRLTRQLLVEGIVMSGAGGVAGLALAIWLTRILSSVAVPYVPRISGLRVDVPVLLMLAVVSIVSGIFFAIVPALTASRLDVRDALQDGGRTAGAGRFAARFRAAIVIAELAIACTLLIAAGLALRSFWQLMQVSPGFTVDHLLTADIQLPETRYPRDFTLPFFDNLASRVRAIPGVEAVGLTNALPMSGGPTTWLTIENRPRPQGEPPEVNYRVVTPGFFRAMQVPLIAGRDVTSDDTPTSLKTVIVNRALVERFFTGIDPIGHRIRIGPNPKAAWRTIVGVVGDMHQAGPESPAVPELYLPLSQDGFRNLSVAVRTGGDPLVLAASLRDVVRSIDPLLPLIDIKTMDARMDEHVASRRLMMLLLGVFAALAFALSLIGVYGVTTHHVSQRTREIGVRMALGAQRADILLSVLRDGGRLAGMGLLAGIGGSLALSSLLGSILYGVTPTDPATFATVAAGMMIIALLACYLPARRAARVDPLTAIRAE
jgi:putative ABC transport system permease protein